MKQHTIDAIKAVATADTPWDTFQALTRAREVLGDEAEAYWPLLETITQRQTEIERLRRLAGCDALTGVANRRTFEDELEREAARHDRTGDSFAVLMLDLDDLKPRNDALGHAAGDRAIVAVADACVHAVRTTDVVARLGGDEFAVLLCGTDLSGARTFASRLRSSIEAQAPDNISLRVSIGVSAMCSEMRNGQEVVVAADLDLYADKDGRKQASAPGDFEAA